MNMPSSKPSFSSALVSEQTENYDIKTAFSSSSHAVSTDSFIDFEILHKSIMKMCHQKISICFHVVFASDHPGIDNTPQIERFQEKAYMELQDYVTRTYPEDSYRLVGFSKWWYLFMYCNWYRYDNCMSPCLFIAPRLSKLLLRLPALRLISAAVTEELFFAGLIGNVQIDSIIPYILKMESTDYNSQAVSGVWHNVPFVIKKTNKHGTVNTQQPIRALLSLVTEWS